MPWQLLARADGLFDVEQHKLRELALALPEGYLADRFDGLVGAEVAAGAEGEGAPLGRELPPRGQRRGTLAFRARVLLACQGLATACCGARCGE